MQCPQCGETKNIYFLVRHQDDFNCQDPNVDNIITILCRNCGKNDSFYLDNYLDMIFPEWKNQKIKQITWEDLNLSTEENNDDSLIPLDGMVSMDDTMPMDFSDMEENIEE